MRYLVNGVETELAAPVGSVVNLGDRLSVPTSTGRASALALRQGDAILVSFQGRTFRVERPGRAKSKGLAGSDGHVRASMPGTVSEVLVEAGDAVAAGDRVAVLEAMKTLQPLLATAHGTVTEVCVAPGDQVAEDQILVRIEADGGKV